MRSKIIIITVFLALMGLLYWYGLTDYISFTYMRSQQGLIRSFIDMHYGYSLLLFVSLYLIMVLCMLPITLVLNIAAGYFYGFWIGSLICIFSAALGALLSMLLFRYVLQGFLSERYERQMSSYKEKFEKHGINYLIALQLLPVTPFIAINISAALSSISAWAFFCTTVVGSTPGILIYAFAGKKFATLKETDSFLSWQLILILLLLSLSALLPMLIRFLRKSRKGPHEL